MPLGQGVWLWKPYNGCSLISQLNIVISLWGLYMVQNIAKFFLYCVHVFTCIYVHVCFHVFMCMTMYIHVCGLHEAARSQFKFFLIALHISGFSLILDHCSWNIDYFTFEEINSSLSSTQTSREFLWRKCQAKQYWRLSGPTNS